MKAFKFMLTIFIHLEFVSARHFQRNDNFTTKETSHTVQTISTPARKVSTTTPSTTAPRPIPRPIGKLV